MTEVAVVYKEKEDIWTQILEIVSIGHRLQMIFSFQIHDILILWFMISFEFMGNIISLLLAESL